MSLNELNVEGFKKPIPKKLFFDFWELFDDGTPLTLIPELLGVSAKKVKAIRDTTLPPDWKEEMMEVRT